MLQKKDCGRTYVTENCSKQQTQHKYKKNSRCKSVQYETEYEYEKRERDKNYCRNSGGTLRQKETKNA